MRKLRLAAASVTILAVFVGPTVTVHATDTTRPSHAVRLTATASPRWIAPGDSATISGTLLFHALPYPGQPVKLFVRTPGTGKGYVYDQRALTADNGTVAFTVTPERRSIYRLVFPGNAEARRCISHRVVVHVKQPTRLAIAATGSRRGPIVAGALGGSGHALAGRPVSLQSWSEDDWSTIATKDTNRRGRVAFLVESGQFRLHFDGTPRYLPSTSPALTIE